MSEKEFNVQPRRDCTSLVREQPNFGDKIRRGRFNRKVVQPVFQGTVDMEALTEGIFTKDADQRDYEALVRALKSSPDEAANLVKHVKTYVE
jgi:hypothetical protein